jgi:acyl-CoA synthetase (AMP-forming)/AMP-acid ligase II
MNRTFRQTLHDRLFGGRTIPAIRFEGHWYSWRDLHAAWRSASEALDAAGVPTNASIVFIARTRVQHAAIILGAFAEGRELAMVYALLSPLAIAREILTSGPRPSSQTVLTGPTK